MNEQLVLQPDEYVDPIIVQTYIDKYGNGNVVDPIQVMRCKCTGRDVIVDGAHRSIAAAIIGNCIDRELRAYNHGVVYGADPYTCDGDNCDLSNGTLSLTTLEILQEKYNTIK